MRLLVENTEAGQVVGGPISAADSDSHRLTYSLDGNDAASFTLDPRNGQLRTRNGVSYDYEVKDRYEVIIRAEDGRGGSASIDVVVDVTDVDERVVASAGWNLTVAVGGTAWLDGTASRTGQGVLTYAWSFHAWPGAIAPVLDDATSVTPSFTAASAGIYVVRLTVDNGSDSATDEVSIVARPVTEAGLLVTADLLVDANRDGVVNVSDEVGEDTWDTASGAVFGPNADDDDEDGVRDGWDDRANGPADLLDMAPVVVRQIPGLHRNHFVVLEMAYSSTSFDPQLFYQRADGELELLLGGGNKRAELPLDRLVAGDLRLYVESRVGRDAGFDGRLSLALTVREGTVVLSQDSVVLRGSPILLSHHLQPVDRVFVMWDAYNSELLYALENHLPGSTDLYYLDYWTYNEDIWIQDFMQTGYEQRPSAGGVETELVHIQMHRGRDLQSFLADEYLGPDAGYVYPGGSYFSNYNYGGNLEVIPPHENNDKNYPFGRMVIGHNPAPDAYFWESMAQQQVDFLNAQGVQGPPIFVDTAWLTVSHVDEVISVLPNHNAESEERSWVIAIASSVLAIDLLEKAVDDGFGNAAVFAGRGGDETTVQRLLDDSRLMELNDAAQQRIDTVRDRLIAEVGLSATDFREVPALYHGYTSPEMSVQSLMPSIVNLLVVNDVLFVADPEGPDVNGKDIWRQATLDAVDGLGLTTHFVDIYDSYHTLVGGVHCGVNTEHEGSTAAWWLNIETEDSQ